MRNNGMSDQMACSDPNNGVKNVAWNQLRGNSALVYRRRSNTDHKSFLIAMRRKAARKPLRCFEDSKRRQFCHMVGVCVRIMEKRQ